MVKIMMSGSLASRFCVWYNDRNEITYTEFRFRCIDHQIFAKVLVYRNFLRFVLFDVLDGVRGVLVDLSRH